MGSQNTAPVFHLIYDATATSTAHRETIPRLFEASCTRHGITFNTIDVASVVLSDLKTLGTHDLLYRCAITTKAMFAQRILISATCAHFFHDWTLGCNSRGTSYFIHKQYGLPVIPSIPGVPSDYTQRVRTAEILGGFPLIIKVLGGTLGVGVIRVDSMDAFSSVLDYISSITGKILVRKYISHSHYIRAIVVGNQVVAAHKAYVMAEDFRTNAGDDSEQRREAVTLPPEQSNVVVEAVRLLGLHTAGVDLLYDSKGKMYIAEVNFPNNFSVTQKVTGVDIADAMVQFLLERQNENALNALER